MRVRVRVRVWVGGGAGRGEGRVVVGPRAPRGARRDYARLVDLVHYRWRHVRETLIHILHIRRNV